MNNPNLERHKSILIISYSYLDRDPRVLRQIETLGKYYEVSTAGLKPSGSQQEKNFLAISSEYVNAHKNGNKFRWRIVQKLKNIFLLRLFRCYDCYYWNTYRRIALKKLSSPRFDLIIANDIDALPLALALKSKHGSSVLFDAHEYSPLEFEDNPKWARNFSPYYTFLCSKYIPYSDANTTVSNEIRTKFFELTGANFELILNSPGYEILNPTAVAEDKIRYVHHGIAIPARKIENIIEAFAGLGKNYELNLILIPQHEKYYRTLQDMARNSSNIIFHDPVPTVKIATYINQFDVSLAIIPPINYNYLYCLPNKFFESVQGRLMILSGPSPEMRTFVEKYELGRITGGFEAHDIRSAVIEITKEEATLYKYNANKAAKELSSVSSMTVLVKKVKELCAELQEY